jgi:hypothetical protein
MAKMLVIYRTPRDPRAFDQLAPNDDDVQMYLFDTDVM